MHEDLIARLRYESEAWDSGIGYVAHLFRQAADALEALQADAERYRYLRSNCECMGECPDDAIDAARTRWLY